MVKVGIVADHLVGTPDPDRSNRYRPGRSILPFDRITGIVPVTRNVRA